MGTAVAQQGDATRALLFWREALVLFERLGDEEGKATTLSHMARLPAREGELAAGAPVEDATDRSFRLYQRAMEVAGQGDPHGALECLRQAEALLDGGDLRARAAVLDRRAILTTQYVDVSRGLELWRQAISLCEQAGEHTYQAAMLHTLSGHVLRQGDSAEGLRLLEQGLALTEKMGDLRAQAAYLHSMARFFDDQGDPARALSLFQQALRMREVLDDAQGKALVLHDMAGTIARQGDVRRAQDLWQQAFELKRKLGDPGDTAATLDSLAWAAFQLGETERGRALKLEAMRLFAYARHWPGLASLLSSLENDGAQETTGWMAQGLWLSLRLPQVSAAQVLVLTEKLVQALPPGSELAPLLATTALQLVGQLGQLDPWREELAGRARRLVEALGPVPERDPERVLRASLEGLERLVGERGWLFPHQSWPA
jgi:tetratricopeptide (TPR) repeat protein